MKNIIILTLNLNFLITNKTPMHLCKTQIYLRNIAKVLAGFARLHRRFKGGAAQYLLLTLEALH